MRSVALLALLCICGAEAAGFYQYQGGPDGAGVAIDAGPERMDVAQIVTVNGTAGYWAKWAPIILDGVVFAYTVPDFTTLAPGSLVSIDRTGHVRTLFESRTPTNGGLASDGRALYFVAEGNLVQMAVDGTILAQAPLHPDRADVALMSIQCPSVMIADAIYVTCNAYPAGQQAIPADQSTFDQDFGTGWTSLLRFDLATMGREAVFYLDAASGAQAERADAFVATSDDDHITSRGHGSVVGVDSFALVRGPDSLVLITTHVDAHPMTAARYSLWAFDPETLELDWSQATWARTDLDNDLARDAQTHALTFVSAIIAQNDGYLLADGHILKRAWGFDQSLWRADLGESTAPTGGMAAHGNALLVSRGGEAFRMDLDSRRVEWQADLGGVHVTRFDSALVSPGRWYLTVDENPALVVGLAGDTGAFEGAVRLPTGLDYPRIAVGDGLLAIQGDTGDVIVVGETSASIQLHADSPPGFPAVGEAVTIDASRSRPGIQSPNTTFEVDWGDGTFVVPKPDGRFTHAYNAEGLFTATLTARNPAGQSSSRDFVFHVGGTPPNFISEAFSPDNQESTFFVLGILAILLGSAFTAVRLRRKRGLLRRELATADAIVAARRDDPDSMRTALRDHRVRARRLFLDGRLDEGSTGILERHVDELLRDHRLSSVEADLSFLPHGLFRSMQEMLRDAKVTQLERNNFLAALGSEKQLTAAQKSRVKQHVDNWHQEDAA